MELISNKSSNVIFNHEICKGVNQKVPPSASPSSRILIVFCLVQHHVFGVGFFD